MKTVITALGTANPPDAYTQDDLLERFRVKDEKVRGFFLNSHISSRRLVLPGPAPDGSIPAEDGTALLDKHKRTAVEIGSLAVKRSLESRGAVAAMVDGFVTVTSTGFLCPGLSAFIAPALGFRRNVRRVDIVGMGCNGGMNGLVSAASLASWKPGSMVVLLMAEICSAAYVHDGSVRSGVVNSLFGDGTAAVIIESTEEDGNDSEDGSLSGPVIVDSESFIVPEAVDEMRFDFADGKFSFFLGRDIPYLIGANVERPVDSLLERNSLSRREVDHWIVHSGGKKVIDSVMINLGLSAWDVRHTRSILNDFGNLSSTSVFFSLERLLDEGVVKRGDTGVMIAMGPGVSIETALLRW